MWGHNRRTFSSIVDLTDVSMGCLTWIDILDSESWSFNAKFRDRGEVTLALHKAVS